MQSIKISRNDYCQFLTISQKNYTLTYFAEHAEKWSHDVVNRFLQRDKYSPALLWEHIKPDIEFSAKGYIIFDDTILEKRNTKKIEISNKEEITFDPNFWNDSKSAQKVMKEIQSLKQWVEDFEKAKQSYEMILNHYPKNTLIKNELSNVNINYKNQEKYLKTSNLIH